MFFIILSSLITLILGNSFTLFNACFDYIYLQYGNEPTLLTTTTSILTPGTSTKQIISYSTVYYQLKSVNNHTILVSSSFNITNENINGIGYVKYPNVGCQLFEYIPNDTSLSSKSVIIYVNGALQDKYSYVGESIQGFVPPKPNSYLQITNNVDTYYDTTHIKFCNSTCSSSVLGSAYIPVGSAIFFFNYYYSSTTTSSSSVSAAFTGETRVEYWCPNCENYPFDLDDDDNWGHPLTSSDLAGICIGGIVFFFLCCGLIYWIAKKYWCTHEKVPVETETTSTPTKDGEIELQSPKITELEKDVVHDSEISPLRESTGNELEEEKESEIPSLGNQIETITEIDPEV